MTRWLALVVVIAGCDLVFPPAGGPGPDAGRDLQSCPAGYDPVQGAPDRYRFEATAASWREGEKVCADDSTQTQTHLVVFSNYGELAAVRAAVTWTPPWSAWAGYARSTTDAPTMFTAVTGEPLSPVSNLWEPGEPTANGEQAVRFDDTFDLTDAAAAVTIGAICECDGRPATVMFDVP